MFPPHAPGPFLAGQILLNNFLSDIPAVGLADDDVDPELVARLEALHDLPEGSLGWSFVEFYRRVGVAMPGLDGSALDPLPSWLGSPRQELSP